MNIRSSVAAWAGVFLAIASWLCVIPARAAKKHRPHSSHKAAQAAHLARVAAKEKAAWRAHLAKLRDLPRRQRLAQKRHEKRLIKVLHTQHVAARAAQRERPAHEAKRIALARRHRPKQAQKPSVHPKRLAQQPVLHAKKVAQKAAPQSAHTKKLAALRAAHDARLSAHSARLARLQAAHGARLAAHNANLARQRAAHDARLRAHQQALAQKALSHQARLAQLRALHNARLAAQRSHWVALHGDGSGGRSIKFWQTVAAGVPVKCITVDLNDDNVKVSAVMARRGTGTSEPFRQMILRAQPNVAVTGTFFSLDNLRPIGDIVIDGSLIHFGGMGTALCVTPDNQAEMVTCEWGRHHDWSHYDFVVACGPRLLRRGRVVLDPRAERFRDRHMLAPNSRIAVGITRGNKVVFVMTKKPIYLGRLAKVMYAVGASEAMNLDAGTSTGFYYNGAVLAHPGRNLTNMIVVYGRRERYRRALPELAPAAYRRMDTHWSPRRVSQAGSPRMGG
ncbi:MAG: phosphodiester glycosidase family protein [Armatimonadetes bacterium]|nr:phosphodiester glycosidase family protein [Armatimonadota bacterium]